MEKSVSEVNQRRPTIKVLVVYVRDTGENIKMNKTRREKQLIDKLIEIRYSKGRSQRRNSTLNKHKLQVK